MDLKQQQERHFALYVIALSTISFWIVIWVMHFCALINAKIKFSKKSHLLAANKKKTKLLFYQQAVAPQCCNQHRQQLQLAEERKENQQQHPSSGPANGAASNSSNAATTQAKQAHHSLTIDDGNLNELDNSNQNEPESSISALQPGATLSTDKICCLRCNQNCNLELPSSQNACPQQLLVLDEALASPEPSNDLTNSTKSVTTNSSNINSNINNHNDSINYKNYYFHIELPLPGVSIIKPLVGVDKNLFENLETFFHLDYPTYEILFCVQDAHDAAIPIVEELFKKYPNADARLFIGGSRVGVNPKINNMQPAYESMKYELLLISDSGIRMQQDTLIDMVSHMNDNVALVHQMPFVNCQGRDSFQSIVERVYFGTVHARAYLTADLLNINCPTGMSALMRKCLLDEVGGIKAFGQYLAEDFYFAKSFTERGWKICICSKPALQNSANSSDSLRTLNLRIQRWIKLRFAMVPQWTLLEPFSECMLLGLLCAIAMSFMWAINPLVVFVLHVLLWFLLDYKLLCTIQNGPLTCSKADYTAAWFIRECTALVVFIKALADPKVTWRSREFKIKWGGFTEEVASELVGDKKANFEPIQILTQKTTYFALQQQQQLEQQRKQQELHSQLQLQLQQQQKLQQQE